MPRPKQPLDKRTMNFRPGDFTKMEAMFPALGPSVAVRQLVSRFIDANFVESKLPADLKLEGAALDD